MSFYYNQGSMLESILPSKQRERDELARDVEQFLLNGGVIQELEPHRVKKSRHVVNTDNGDQTNEES